MLCSICNVKESKYTCPTCLCKYCSLACFKSDKHKEMDQIATEKKVKLEESNVDVTESSSTNAEEQVIDDPMLAKLSQNTQFQEYISSPVLQFHILTVLEILDNISLTNEYSKDGRTQIASRKLNDLRKGGLEENEYVEEFICWLLNWMDEYKEGNV